MESVGFPDIKMNEMPILSESWPKIIEGGHVLVIESLQ